MEATLHNALKEASDRRHAFATLEHLLSALTYDEDAIKVLNACAVNVPELQDNVRNYIDNELESVLIPVRRPKPTKSKDKEELAEAQKLWDEYKNRGPSPTAGFQRVVQRSILHVQSQNKAGGIVSAANVLVALFSERDSYAVYFLQKQDMSRLDAVSFISHGVGKASSLKEKEVKDDKKEKKQNNYINKISALPGSLTRKLNHDLITHSDAVSRSPSLFTPNIASKIVDFVDELLLSNEVNYQSNYQKAPTIAVGVYGAWGSGKSTLLTKIADTLIGDGAVVATINAWKWDGEQDIFSFMNGQLLASLHKTKEYRWKVRGIRCLLYFRKHLKKLTFFATLAFAVAVFLILIGWDAVYNSQIEINSIFAALGAGTFVALLRPIISLFEKYLLRNQKDVDPDETLSASYRYLLLAKNIGRSKSKPIYFIFDDLDRCDPDRVVRFMKSIHRLTLSGSVSIIGCDDRIVGASIYHQFKQIADLSGEGLDFGSRFLEKIVQVHFRMPELEEMDLVDLGLSGVLLSDQVKKIEESSTNEISELSSPEQLKSHLVKDLGEDDPEIDLINLSIICGQVLGAAVELYPIPIRKVKFLSNLLKLYTMVFPPTSEASAYRLAAFIVLTNLDCDKLRSHCEGQTIVWNRISAKAEFSDRMNRYLGSDRKATNALFPMCGLPRHAARLKASGGSPPNTE